MIIVSQTSLVQDCTTWYQHRMRSTNFIRIGVALQLIHPSRAPWGRQLLLAPVHSVQLGLRQNCESMEQLHMLLSVQGRQSLSVVVAWAPPPAEQLAVPH